MAKKARTSGNIARRKTLAPMTRLMRFYFRAWLGRPKLFGNRSDEHYFFFFVKACLNRTKASRDGYWLRRHLEKERNLPQHWIDMAAKWFDICAAYDDSAKYFSENESVHQFLWAPGGSQLWRVRQTLQTDLARRSLGADNGGA